VLHSNHFFDSKKKKKKKKNQIWSLYSLAPQVSNGYSFFKILYDKTPACLANFISICLLYPGHLCLNALSYCVSETLYVLCQVCSYWWLEYKHLHLLAAIIIHVLILHLGNETLPPNFDQKMKSWREFTLWNNIPMDQNSASASHFKGTEWPSASRAKH
jgi:hypothetical protein